MTKFRDEDEERRWPLGGLRRDAQGAGRGAGAGGPDRELEEHDDLAVDEAAGDGHGEGEDAGTPPWPGMPGQGGVNQRSYVRRYTAEAKAEVLRDFESSSQTVREFCAQHGLNTRSFCRWRRRHRELGMAGLEPQPNPRSRGGAWRVISPEERRALVEAYLQLKLPQAVFAKSYGISVASLTKWLRAYREHGPKGLEPKPRGRRKGSGGMPRLPEPVRAEIVATRRRFPGFGLRKVRDYLKRFFGIRVSTGGVRSALAAEGIGPQPVLRKRHRGADRVRRFERSRPSGYVGIGVCGPFRVTVAVFSPRQEASIT